MFMFLLLFCSFFPVICSFYFSVFSSHSSSSSSSSSSLFLADVEVLFRLDGVHSFSKGVRIMTAIFIQMVVSSTIHRYGSWLRNVAPVDGESLIVNKVSYISNGTGSSSIISFLLKNLTWQGKSLPLFTICFYKALPFGNLVRKVLILERFVKEYWTPKRNITVSYGNA